MNQTQKFNARYGKKKADEVAESNYVQDKIAAAIEERKQELNSIAVLTNSVQILSKQIENLFKERVTATSVMEEMAAKLNTIMIRQTQVQLGEFDSAIRFMMDQHRRGTFLSPDELYHLGIDMYSSVLHKWRALQISETGSFTDPAPIEESVPVQDKEWLVKPKDKAIIGVPRGPKPAYIKAAIEIMDKYRGGTNMKWKAGGKELVFAVLTYLEWTNVKIKSTSQLQACREGNALYQSVNLRKYRYGITEWSEIMDQYYAAKEVK